MPNNEPERIQLEISAPDMRPPVDRAYSDREAEIRWGMALYDPTLNQAAEAGMGAATPEQVAAAPQGATPEAGPPEVPGRQPTGFVTSPLEAGALETWRRLGGAAQNTLTGLAQAMLPSVAPGGVAEAEIAKAGTRGPALQIVGEMAGHLIDKVAGVRQAVIGLLGVPGAPLSGIGAAITQMIDNTRPGTADAEAPIDPVQAGFMRLMSGQEGTPQELNRPMTNRELIDLAVQTAPLWVPATAAAGKVTGKRILRTAMSTDPEGGRFTKFGMGVDPTEFASERGSMGGPLSGAALSQRAEVASAVSPAPAASAGSPAGVAAPPRSRAVGALNLERVSAADTVKNVMARLNERAGAEPRIAAHRERVSHAQTLEAAKKTGLDVKKLMETDLEEWTPSAAEGQAARDAATAVATVVADLEARMRKGDVQAQREYIPTAALGLALSMLDEVGKRNVARSLEANKIASVADRASMRDMAALARRLGAETGIEPATQGAADIAREATTARRRLEKAGHAPEETFNVAELVAAKIGGELALTTIAAELIRTANGGTMPTRISAAEVIAAKIAAELQASQPQISPQALLGVYRAIERAQHAAEADQARAADAMTVQLANLLAASGYKAPVKGLTLADIIARKIETEMLSIPGATEASAPAILLAMRQQLATEAQRRGWFQSWAHAALFVHDAGQKTWVQSLLTNPLTWKANLYGTGVGMGWDLFLERPVAEAVNRWFRHDPEGVQAGEWWQAMSHPVLAIQDAVRLMGESLETGRAPFEKGATAGKPEVPHISADAYGFAPNTFVGQVMDTTGKVLDSKLMPAHVLLTSDAALKGIAYRWEIGAQSVVEANAEARAADAAGTPMTAQAIQDRITRLQLEPTPRMMMESEDKANLLTLNKELGPLGQLMTQGRNISLIGQWIIPFMRWATNATKWAGQRLPITSWVPVTGVTRTPATGEINIIWSQNWKDYQAGGRLRDQAIARVVVGNAVLTAIGYQVLTGRLSGPHDFTQEQREEKFYTELKPNSMRLPGGGQGEYVRNFGQVGMAVSAIAGFFELQRLIPNQQWYEQWIAYGAALTQAIGHMFVQQPAMVGLKNLLEEVNDPVGKGNALMRSFARSAVPAGLREFTRVQDDNVIRDVHSMNDAFKSGLPVMVQDIPPLRHPIGGQRVQIPSGWGWNLLSPILWARANHDPVDQAIVNNGLVGSAQPLPWTVGGTTNPGDGPLMTEPVPGEGVRLSPEEHDAWIVHMTKDELNGQTYHDAMMELVTSQRFRQDLSPGPGGGQAAEMLKIIQAYRKYATGALFTDPRFPDLIERVKQARETRVNAMRDVTDPQSPHYTSGGVRFNPGALLQSLGR